MNVPIFAKNRKPITLRPVYDVTKIGDYLNMRPFDKISNPRQIRNRLSLNQQEFWARIGVTQSGGSRYESGRKMPKPVRELLRLVHVEGMELASAKRDDLQIIAYLKRNPGLYRKLSKAAAKRNGKS